MIILIKKVSFRSLLASVLAACMILSGCNILFDPQKYLQVSLDALYKGDVSEYAEMVGISEEQAQQNYQASCQSELELFAKLYQIDPVSESVKLRIYDLYKQLYSMASYTVGEDVSEDGVCMVELTVKPINFFVDIHPSVEEYVKAFNNNATAGAYNNVSAQEYMDIYANGLLDLFFSNLSSVGYGDEVYLTVVIDHDTSSNSYSISSDSLVKIADAVIAYPGE